MLAVMHVCEGLCGSVHSVCMSDMLCVNILFMIHRHPRKSRKTANFCSRTILGTKRGKETRKEGSIRNKDLLKVIPRLTVE